MSESKRDKVEEFIKARVKECLAEIAFNGDEPPEVLRRVNEKIDYRMYVRLDRYQMRELKDIMDWKKPREV